MCLMYFVTIDYWTSYFIALNSRFNVDFKYHLQVDNTNKLFATDKNPVNSIPVNVAEYPGDSGFRKQYIC